MDPNQTLHDFVLNLITNSEARSAFQLDPEGTLNEAGLGDITAADVQDVVPLVVDYASLQGTAGLDPVALEADQGTLGGDPTDVIGQLQAVTQQLAGAAQPASIDGNLAAAGTIAVDSGGLGAAATGWGGMGVAADASGVSADLSGGNDLAATLDSGVVDPAAADPAGTVEATADATVGTVDGLVGGSLDGGLGSAGSLAGGLTSPLDESTGLVDSLGATGQPPVSLPDLGPDEGSSPVGGATGAADETLDSVGAGNLLGGDGLSGDAEAHGSVDASAPGTQGSGLLDDATDILG